MAMTPFRVSAQMLRGVVMEPYSLDLAGILSSRMWRAQKSRSSRIDSMIEHPEDFDLPLDICDHGQDWHWMGTCGDPGVPDDAPQEPRAYYRVVGDSDAHRFGDRPLPYYHPQSSAYRDVMMPAQVTLTGRLTWYGVGDAEKIEALVKGIRSVGKRRAKGEGRVLSWDVEEISGDPFTVGHTGDTGRILRPIPVECAETLALDYREEWFCIRPPSWNPNRLRQLAVAPEDEMYVPDEWEL